MQVSKYFQTGSYNATCDNKGIFDFEGAKNCTQVGPALCQRSVACNVAA